MVVNKSPIHSKIIRFLIAVLMVVSLSCGLVTKTEYNALAKSFSHEEIPKWNGKASVVVKDNKPSFSSDQKKTKKYPAIIDRKKNYECT